MERPRTRFTRRSTIGHRRGITPGSNLRTVFSNTHNSTCLIMTEEKLKKTCVDTRLDTGRQNSSSGGLAAHTALPRSDDIALEARWHHHHLPSSVFFSRLATAQRAREITARLTTFLRTFDRNCTRLDELDRINRVQAGHQGR